MITSFSSVIVVVLPYQWNLFVSENNDFPEKHLFAHDLICLLTIGYTTFSVNGIVDDDICISSEINYLHNYSLSFVVNNSCKFGQALKMGWKKRRIFIFIFWFFGFCTYQPIPPAIRKRYSIILFRGKKLLGLRYHFG